MARSTAKDRLRGAHELQRRPVLADALARGQLSYAKVKILTRIEGLGDECDHTLAASAAAGTVADTEGMYQRYKLHRQQNDPPPDVSRWDRCGIETIDRNNGIATMELRVPDDDEQRILK